MIEHERKQLAKGFCSVLFLREFTFRSSELQFRLKWGGGKSNTCEGNVWQIVFGKGVGGDVRRVAKVRNCTARSIPVQNKCEKKENILFLKSVFAGFFGVGIRWS